MRGAQSDRDRTAAETATLNLPFFEYAMNTTSVCRP